MRNACHPVDRDRATESKREETPCTADCHLTMTESWAASARSRNKNTPGQLCCCNKHIAHALSFAHDMHQDDVHARLRVRKQPHQPTGSAASQPSMRICMQAGTLTGNTQKLWERKTACFLIWVMTSVRSHDIRAAKQLCRRKPLKHTANPQGEVARLPTDRSIRGKLLLKLCRVAPKNVFTRTASDMSHIRSACMCGPHASMLSCPVQRTTAGTAST